MEDLGLSNEQLEARLLYWVNQERSSHGLPDLRFDLQLQILARAHSRKMLQERTLSHDFPAYDKLDTRAAKAGLYFSQIGENVARGDTFVMRLFHAQLLASPEHRENILGKQYRQLGIGVECCGNMYYVTQVFADLIQPQSPLKLEAEIEKKLQVQFGAPPPLPPPTEGEIKEFCRRMSSQYLQNQPTQTLMNPYGSFSIVNLNFLDMETVLAALRAEPKASRLLYWTIGVSFGRSDRNPGGVYALSLMRFPDLRSAASPASDQVAVIFESFNRIRLRNSLRSPPLKPALNRAAADIARLFYRSPDDPGSIRNKDRYKQILTYQTVSLAAIPDDIGQKIIACPKLSAIGIAAFYPLAEGLPGNYFIVAILGI